MAEDKQIEMMENVEYLCQAFDSIKLAEINSKLSTLKGIVDVLFILSATFAADVSFAGWFYLRI